MGTQRSSLSSSLHSQQWHHCNVLPCDFETDVNIGADWEHRNVVPSPPPPLSKLPHTTRQPRETKRYYRFHAGLRQGSSRQRPAGQIPTRGRHRRAQPAAWGGDADRLPPQPLTSQRCMCRRRKKREEEWEDGKQIWGRGDRFGVGCWFL